MTDDGRWDRIFLDITCKSYVGTIPGPVTTQTSDIEESENNPKSSSMAMAMDDSVGTPAAAVVAASSTTQRHT